MMIVEMDLTLLTHAKMPLKYWDDAFITSVFLLNNLPLVARGFLTPYEVLYHKALNYQFLKVLECSCFPNLREYNQHKLDFHSSKSLILGYSPYLKVYKCLHLSSRSYISRHVVFNEVEFPYQ